MKKCLFALFAFAAICLTITGCAKNESGLTSYTAKELSSSEFGDCTGLIDRIPLDDLETVEQYTDVIVEGTFINDPTQKIYYEYEPNFDREIAMDVHSYNTIEVTKVIAGDVSVGDKLKIVQNCGIIDKKFVTWSSLTPMQKGDSWLFCLGVNSAGDLYHCAGDSSGRFPIPESEAKVARIGFSDCEEYGVYDRAQFREDLYNELLNKYYPDNL